MMFFGEHWVDGHNHLPLPILIQVEGEPHYDRLRSMMPKPSPHGPPGTDFRPYSPSKGHNALTNNHQVLFRVVSDALPITHGRVLPVLQALIYPSTIIIQVPVEAGSLGKYSSHLLGSNN